MTRDWIAAAAALAPDIPEEARERLQPPMEALEASFRPLVAMIPLETEPSYVQLVDRKQDA